MRFTVVLLVLVSLPFAGVGQRFPSQQWHEGEATLKDNTVVRGRLNYDLSRDAIQLEVNGRIETYSSQLVLKFSFIQNDDGFERRFFALPYAAQPGYKVIPRFFEVIIEGKMTLLAREYISQITTGTGGPRFNRYRNYPLASSTPRTITRNVLTYKMFFLDHNGNLTEYTGRKKDLYYVLNSSSADLKKYVKSNRLKVDKLADVAKLVVHYNTLI